MSSTNYNKVNIPVFVGSHSYYLSPTKYPPTLGLRLNIFVLYLWKGLFVIGYTRCCKAMHHTSCRKGHVGGCRS